MLHMFVIYVHYSNNLPAHVLEKGAYPCQCGCFAGTGTLYGDRALKRMIAAVNILLRDFTATLVLFSHT